MGQTETLWKHVSMTQEPLDVGPRKVFVVSPIGKAGSDVNRRANYALKYLIRAALQEPDWVVHRADEGTSPDSIGHHVIKQIADADLIVADLTDHNPNVFYELAIAHGWRKPVVHLNTVGQSVPFDIVDLRTIFYDITDLASVEQCIIKLREYAEAVIGKGEELVTPLSNFARFSAVAADTGSPGEAVAIMFDDISARLSHLDSRVRQISAAQDRPSLARSPETSREKAEDFIEVSRLLANSDLVGIGGVERGRLLYEAQRMWEEASPKTRSYMKHQLAKEGVEHPF
jgi:hypothetical protein